tara:strand:- start:543 stop:797 length:255 start_codon:yes stop_codon:yes gene_type:complete
MPIKKVDNFFLCFPETDSEYQYLKLEEKIEIRKQISEEKFNRNIDCGIFSDYMSGEQNLNNINAEERRKELGDCMHRGEPCRYD